MTMKEKLKKGFSKAFNKNTPVLSALATVLPTLALGATAIWYTLDHPTTERTPVRGDQSVAALSQQFNALQKRENDYKDSLQASVASGAAMDPSLVAKNKTAHETFARSLLLNRDISERDFQGFAGKYTSTFNNIYLGQEQTFDTGMKYNDGTKKLHKYTTTLDYASQAKFFGSCQTEVFQATALSDPEKLQQHMESCLQESKSGWTFLAFLEGMATFGFCIAAAAGSEDLRKKGQKWKDEFDQQTRAQAAAQAAAPAHGTHPHGPGVLQKDLKIDPPLQLKNKPPGTNP